MHDKLAWKSHGPDTPAQSHGELRKLLSETQPDIKEMLQPFLKISAAAANNSDASFRSVKTNRLSALPSILLDRTTSRQFPGRKPSTKHRYYKKTSVDTCRHSCLVKSGFYLFNHISGLVLFSPSCSAIRDGIAALSSEWFSPEVLLFLPYRLPPREGVFLGSKQLDNT